MLEQMALQYIERRYYKEFGDLNSDDLQEAIKNYENLKTFKANENVYDKNDTCDDITHFVMRMATEYYLTKALEAQKIDMNDSNIGADESSGNIGTAGRIAKTWCGKNMDDENELGSGRWNKPPRIATFPNANGTNTPITKVVELTSNCSHHFLPFTTIFGGKCLISYIPNPDFVIGISKLPRFINKFLGKRFWLQEDLTQEIGRYMAKIAKTEDIYVEISECIHTCERIRGAKDSEGSMTTVYKSGKFEIDSDLVNSVKWSQK